MHIHHHLLPLLFRLLPILPLLLIGAQTAVAAPLLPPAGLIGWWTGDSNAVDLVNGNNATLLNGATYTNGQVDAAFYFDGVNDTASAPDSPAWAFGTNEFTIELWANFAANTGQRALVASDTGGGTQNKWIFWLNNNVLQFHINGTPGTAFIGTAAFTPTLNQWYHLAVTRKSTNYVFYINGSAVSTNSDARLVPDANAALTFGSAEGSLFFAGQLDEISLYNRALADNEIANIVTANTGGKDKTLYGAPITIWTNSASGDWNTASNWTPNRVPRPWDKVYVTNNGTFTVTISNNTANADTLYMGYADTNVTGIRTLSVATGSLTLTNAAIETNGVLNFGGGTLTVRGLAQAKGNFNWTAGTINGGGELQAGAGGITTISGAGAKTLSGVTLGNFSGNASWSGANWTINNGATFSNYGYLQMTNDQTFAYSSGTGVGFDNFGTVVKSGGTGPFLLSSVRFRNSGDVFINSGSLSLTAITATNTGNLNIGGAGQLLLNSGTLQLGGAVSAPTANSVQFIGGTATITTPNITSPAIWIAGAGVVQQTNISVSAINESAGYLYLLVPCFLNQLNQTNGELRGRDLTVTNFNWYAGNLNSRAPGESISGAADRTIIPAGGVLNILGTADRVFSYYTAPGRGLDNFGTINWSAPIQLRGNGGSVVNNYGNVFVTAGAPNVQYDWAGAGANPVWNNYGNFTRSTASTIFYFDSVYLNNYGFMDIQTGTLSVYNSTATNQPGAAIHMSSGTTFLVENTSDFTLAANSSLTHPDSNGIQLISGNATIASTNVVTPALWINGALVNQQTNIVVPLINQSAGVLYLQVPNTLATYNLTNGELRGRDLTVTNFNWFAGNLNSRAPGESISGPADRVIIPAGGVLNILGTADRVFSYYTAPGRGLDNFGTINWSAPIQLRGNGGSVVNNYGNVFVTASSPNVQYDWAGAGANPVWNNYGNFTRSTASTIFYFDSVYLNNYGFMDIQTGTLDIYNSTFTNVTGAISIGASALFQSENSSVGALNAASQITAPTANSIRFGGASMTIDTTNIVSPSIWQQAGTLYQRTNITVSTLNMSGGFLELGVPAALNQLNQTNGWVQGRTITITNWNWYAGHHVRGVPTLNDQDDRTIIPPGGVMNLLGTTARNLTYYTGTGPSRTLDNYGTINWSGDALLYSYGLFNNYGSVNVTATGTPEYLVANTSLPPTWNNYGTFTRSAGTVFYFNGSYVNNTGLMDIQQGTLSMYGANFTNSSGIVNLSSSAIFQSENNAIISLNALSQIIAPAANSIRLGGATAVIATTNIVSPSIWQQTGTLYQSTNITVSTLNMSGGFLELGLPVGLNQLNQTSGWVQGRTITITNWNWYDGHHVRGVPNLNDQDDRTIIPVGGVMNLLGTASRNLTYYSASGPSRTLDNYGTVNWSGNMVLGSYGQFNNYGAVNVTASGTAQYYNPTPAVPSFWNNYGTFTRSVGSLFYFQNGFINNTGTMDVQSGTLSIYGATLTNSSGGINLGASALLQTEASGIAVLSGPSRLTAPIADSIRFGGASATIETTNIVSPTIWLQAGTLYQRTNFVVSSIDESGGALQLDVPNFLNQLNQTNGDVQGRNLTVTNWNWYAGNHYRGTSGINTNDDRTIIPPGGVMNLLGASARALTYYSASGPSRTLDNYGTVNWLGAAVITSYGQFNNYGSVSVSANGTAQYYGPSGAVPSIWNNYGNFTRSVGPLFYFQNGYVNNAGTMNIQGGTLSIYNATFTNQPGGSVLVLPAAVLANDNTATSVFEAGSSLACATTNAFQINSGTVTLRSTGVTAPSLWINGGTLIQSTNNSVATINESAGTWKLNVPISLANYNLTNGELRGANLTVDTFNWLGGGLNADGPGSNTVSVTTALNIIGAAGKSMSYYTAPGRTLINNGNAIWGGGNITFSGQSAFINNGTWTVTNDVTLGWTGTGLAAPVFQNNGTFNKTAGTGLLTLGSTTFTNSGTVAINSGGFSLGGDLVQTAGSAYLGTNFTAGSSVVIQAGLLTGRGTIAGALYNNGVVNPGASPGFINGASYTNTSAATYNVEIGGNTGAGTNYDQMRFSGPIRLDGTLNVSLYNNYALILSNKFTVLTTSARTGTFANVIPPPGASINTIYSSTNVVLEISGLTNAPLQVLTNPVSQTIWTPDPVTFSATVSGVTPLTFQWQFNGTNISGANSASYTIPAVAVTNGGLYTLKITDGVGGTTNVSATLTVIPFANIITWTNLAGGNWSVPANWMPNRIPNPTNNVLIVSNGTYTVTVDVTAALSNLTVGAIGATGTPTVQLVSGQSLSVNGNTSWETNSVLALNGLLQMNGGSNSIRGHIDWQFGTLSGAGRTVIATNASLTFIGSLNQKFIATNILENYGAFNYGNDSFGNAQGLRFSGGAQLTNYPSGVITIGTASYDYSGAQTPRSYLVNYGTISTTSSGLFSPSYISIDFVNYGLLNNSGYVYLSRGTNYGTFQELNALCEISIFGDPSTGEYFSFEPGTSLTGPRPNIDCGGPVQWRAGNSVHNGRLYIGSGSGGATYPNAEFKVLANYTNTYQVAINRGAFTVNNPALTTELRNFVDAAASTWSFVITNVGTMNADNLSHAYFGFNNSGSILVRSNLTLAISSVTYGGGTISIANTASATFSGGTVDSETVLNRGTNSVTGTMSFTGNTFYRNYPGARTYFGGGSFITGPASLLNEGLLDGFGGLAINTTNRNTVLADDPAGRTLALGNYVQESGLTDLNPGPVSGTLEILGGQLSGTNTIAGSVRNYANFAPGKPFGLLSVTGNFTNTAGGTYVLPISGARAITNFPQTRVQGTSYLAGTLYVNFTNGFNPVAGNLFTAMVFTARSGVFDSIVNDTYGLEAFYTSTTLVLRAQNLLPNLSVTIGGGTTQLVCQAFSITANAVDPDGAVTNLLISINGSPAASKGGVNLNNSPFKTMADSDFPTVITVVAQATDDRNGVRTVTVPVNIYNFSKTNVLFLGGVRTNDFKLCMVGETGRNYEVYGITNLTTTNWVDLGSMTQSNGTWRYLDQTTITNRKYRFYRTQQLP